MAKLKYIEPDYYDEEPTKTLLDEFAMAAMIGLLANPKVFTKEGCEYIAPLSYGIALDMLKEKEKKETADDKD